MAGQSSPLPLNCSHAVRRSSVCKLATMTTTRTSPMTSQYQSTWHRPPVLQGANKSLTIYRTQRFIAACTRLRHFSLKWSRLIQSTTASPTCWRFILLLSCLGCSEPHSGLFLSQVSHHNPVHIFITMRTVWPTHLSLLRFPPILISLDNDHLDAHLLALLGPL